MDVEISVMMAAEGGVKVGLEVEEGIRGNGKNTIKK